MSPPAPEIGKCDLNFYKSLPASLRKLNFTYMDIYVSMGSGSHPIMVWSTYHEFFFFSKFLIPVKELGMGGWWLSTRRQWERAFSKPWVWL